MKQVTQLLSAGVVCFFLFACNQASKKDESSKTDTTKTKTEAQPGFDASMDALTTAGYPSRILADSLDLKAYEFVVNPGDSVPLHSHPDHVIYVLEDGTGELKGADGNSQVLEFKKGTCMIFGPDSHSAKNTGTSPLKLLIVHVYRPRS